MRIPTALFGLCLLFSTSVGLQAQQDPGAQQDTEAAREKLLKAADQLDNIQANSETTRTSVDGMKADVTKLQGDLAKLQTDNATLRQQVADLQASLDEEKTARIKDRQALIDNVADLIASSKNAVGTKTPKKKTSAAVSNATAESSPANTPPTHPAPDAETIPSTSTSGVEKTSGSLTSPTEATPVKPQKGYYHVVANGETLTLICEAYKQQGVNVSVSQVRKANGLTDKSVLKVGQKLFIPKPGN